MASRGIWPSLCFRPSGAGKEYFVPSFSRLSYDAQWCASGSCPGEEQKPFPALSRKSAEESRHRPQLVIVEDNRADVFLVEEAIRLYDVSVDLVVISDGEQAINLIEEAERDPNAVCPDILLLDLNLPRRSGTEVLRRLRATGRCTHIPVIIFSSSDSPQDRAATAELGATRYLRKPSDYDQFLKIGQVLKEIVGQINRRPS